jgi:23S rRNA pseudouridine2605 synthase
MFPSPKPGTERLQVVLARFGIASRRGVVSLIEDGKVTVNGEVVREKGFRVDAKKDEIKISEQELTRDAHQKKRYFLFYKPKNVMTTMQDPHAEHTVAEFFQDIPERLFPVGRLDRDTTGLILMTNDGELSFRLTHPKFGVKKKYHVRVKGVVPEEEIKRLEAGVMLEEGKTAPCKIDIEKFNPRETWLRVVLHEGKKRQIRRLFEGIGHRVIDLERTDYGPLSLGLMKPGEKRELRVEEVRRLKEAAGLSKAGASRKE